MAIRMPRIIHGKQFLGRSSLAEQNAAATARDIPRGCFVVYVGEGEKKRVMIPIAYLNKSLFQDLLVQAGEEYEFDHPIGGIAILCREHVFSSVISYLSRICIGFSTSVTQFCEAD